MKNNIHYMNLLRLPFEEIEQGRKTVEMRLFDEKRRGIKIGDTVVFACADLPGREIRACVTDTRVYEDFFVLAQCYAAEELGFGGKSAEYIAGFMTDIYGVEKLKAYKAFAIKIRKET
jgi:ASC-1-like (ASCH) protein